MGVWARGDEILIAEFDFIMAGGITIIFCNKTQLGPFPFLYLLSSFTGLGMGSYLSYGFYH